jgi:hypothetical protein
MSSSEYIDNKNLFNNIKTVVWNCGLDGNLDEDEQQVLFQIVGGGKSLLLTGANIARSTTGQIIPLFGGGCLSVDYVKDCFVGEGSVEFSLEGILNDPVSNNFDQSCKLNKYRTPYLEISNYLKAYPLLRHKNMDTVVATRYLNQGNKAVYLAILPEIIINETERNSFIKKALDWLEGTTGVDDNTATGLVRVSSSPNPVNNKTNICYTLAGEKSKLVDMFLVDVNGKKVAPIMKKVLSPGDYTYEFDASGLVSGSYYIITLIDDDRLITPLSVVK